MTIDAARELRDGQVCLVGVGPPNAAANLARRLHAPELRAGLRVRRDRRKARPAAALDRRRRPRRDRGRGRVGAEMFNYWSAGGRIDVGFLGAAQIDRHANLNTTVIGPYEQPKVRLPGAGGAPEIAAARARS